jgi:hypothetical protein
MAGLKNYIEEARKRREQAKTYKQAGSSIGEMVSSNESDPWAIESVDTGGDSGGGGGAGGGYMQGIAAIGNALNDSHRNVENTLARIRGETVTQKEMFELEKDKFGEQKRQFDEGTRRSLNQSALEMLLGQRQLAGQGVRSRTFKDALSSAMRGRR